MAKIDIIQEVQKNNNTDSSNDLDDHGGGMSAQIIQFPTMGRERRLKSRQAKDDLPNRDDNYMPEDLRYLTMLAGLHIPKQAAKNRAIVRAAQRLRSIVFSHRDIIRVPLNDSANEYIQRMNKN